MSSIQTLNTTPSQVFIQTVLLDEQRLSFRMLWNAGGGLEVLQALQLDHGGALVWVQGL